MQKMWYLIGTFVVVGLLVNGSVQAATVPETPANNDMDPCFTDDGWNNTVGSYDCITAAGFANHVYLPPPDGNNYGGGVQYGGVPGTTETIAKTYTNLVIGQVYAVEWYLMTDLVQTPSTEAAEAWFDVSLCSDQQETFRLTPGDRRVWMPQRLYFTADATTCDLSFAARNTLGDNGSWVFLDGVAIGQTVVADLGITKTGPSNIPVAGGPVSYTITVVNNGPDTTGGTVDVTDSLPVGASINGGVAGAVSLSGANAGDWSCISDAGGPQVISCTSIGTFANGASSTFSYTVTAAAGSNGDTLINLASVVPTLGSSTQDTNSANDSSSWTTTLPVELMSFEIE